MRSSELFAPSGQADALPTFAVTAGSLAAYAVQVGEGCARSIACGVDARLRRLLRRVGGGVRGDVPAGAVGRFRRAGALARAARLPGRDDPRELVRVAGRSSAPLFQVSAIAVAFAATALADLAFLALQAAVVCAAGGAAPALLKAYRVVARKRSGAGRGCSRAGRCGLCRSRRRRQPSRRIGRRGARVGLSHPVLPAGGAVLGCIQGVGADLVLAHEQLAGGYVANSLLVAAALAIAAALVSGAAFAHDGDDARRSPMRG